MAEKIKDTEYGSEMKVYNIGKSTLEPPKNVKWISVEITEEDVERMLNEREGGRKAGRGDSPYTQEYYEELYGITRGRTSEALPKGCGGCSSGSIRIWDHNVPVITEIIEGDLYPSYMDFASRRMDSLVADNGILHELRMAAASNAYYTSELLRDMYDIARWTVLTTIEQDTDYGYVVVPAPSYEDLQDASFFKKYAPEAKQRVIELRQRQNAWARYNKTEDRVDRIPRALMFRTANLCIRTDDPLNTLDNMWKLFGEFLGQFLDDRDLKPRFPDYGEIMRSTAAEYNVPLHGMRLFRFHATDDRERSAFPGTFRCKHGPSP